MIGGSAPIPHSRRRSFAQQSCDIIGDAHTSPRPGPAQSPSREKGKNPAAEARKRCTDMPYSNAVWHNLGAPKSRNLDHSRARNNGETSGPGIAFFTHSVRQTACSCGGRASLQPSLNLDGVSWHPKAAGSSERIKVSNHAMMRPHASPPSPLQKTRLASWNMQDFRPCPSYSELFGVAPPRKRPRIRGF